MWSTRGSDWAPGLSGGVTWGRSLSLLVLQVPHLEPGMIMVLNSWSCREDGTPEGCLQHCLAQRQPHKRVNYEGDVDDFFFTSGKLKEI